MARSFRRTPIIGNCSYGAGSMRSFRRQTNKKLRARTKAELAKADTDDVLDPRTPHAVIERWTAPDDGRLYHADLDSRFLRK